MLMVSLDHGEEHEAMSCVLHVHGLSRDGGALDLGMTEIKVSWDDRGIDRGIEIEINASNPESPAAAAAALNRIRRSFVREGFMVAGVWRS
jgi:hypothetical protein